MPSSQTNHPLSDEKLVQKSLQDVNYFGTLIERYENKLQTYILRISSFSLEEAEDILQEVFLKAWKDLASFDQTLKFSSWIYRIAHNHVISSYRKHKSRGYDKNVSLDDKLFHLASPELAIETQLNQKTQAQFVRATLLLLSSTYREILVLRYFEDKSYAEISDILKKPEGTVATLLSRAKKQFKELILKKDPNL